MGIISHFKMCTNLVFKNIFVTYIMQDIWSAREFEFAVFLRDYSTM